MRPLTRKEEDFFKDLLKYTKRIHRGYYCYGPKNKKYGNKDYTEHRVLMQLHLKMKLEPWEVIHHKDRNKLNNSIENLEVMKRGDHSSEHNAGSNKIGKYKPYNKFDKSKIEKINKLAKIHLKSNGKPNCSKIARILGIAGLTVSRYVVTSKK